MVMGSATVWWAFSYAVGILVGAAAPPSGQRWLIGGALALGGLALLGRARGTTLLSMAFAVGVYAQSCLPEPLAGDILQSDRLLLPRFEGTVLEAPALRERGSGFRVAIDRLASQRPAGSEGGDGEARFAVAPALVVQVVVQGPLQEPLWPGDRVLIRGSLRAIAEAGNPESAPPLRLAASQGIRARLAVAAEAVLRLDEEAGPSSLALRAERWTARLRARLLGLVAARLHPQKAATDTQTLARAERHALVAALTLGDRGPLFAVDALRRAQGSEPLSQRFRRAGIEHVLSVSGLHLAVAIALSYRGLCALLLLVPGLGERWVARRWAAAASLPIVGLYTVLTGGALATQRAALVVSLMLLAELCGRRARLGDSVAITVLCLAGPFSSEGAPQRLFDPGLQLSLAATLGIAFLHPLAGLRRWAGGWRAGQGRVGRLSLWTLRLAAWILDAALAAVIATAPLCALHFGLLEAQPFLASLCAVPIAELVVVPLGLAGAVLSTVAPGAGGVLLDLASGAAAVLIAVVSALARFGVELILPAPGALGLTAYAAGLGLWAAGRRLGPIVLMLTVAGYLLAWALPTGELRVTALDVGQGDAIVVELPRSGLLVVDGGPGAVDGGPWDSGALVVTPFLRRRGHRKIDVLVASHGHPDHYGGLSSLLSSFAVGELWIAASTEKDSAEPGWQRVLALARQRGVKILPPVSGRLGGVDVAVLSQPGPPPSWGENDRSLVLRLEYAGRRVLLTGDIERRAEAELLGRLPAATDPSDRIDVLKAPHHCSRTSSTAALLERLRPRVAICSVGRDNRFGFPHAEVVARYEGLSSRILRTDREGGIELRIGRSGELRWLSRPYRGSGWQVSHLIPPS